MNSLLTESSFVCCISLYVLLKEDSTTVTLWSMGWFVSRPEMGMGYVYPTNSWQGSFGIPSNHCQAWELSSPTEIFAILCYSDWCMLEFDGRTGATKTAAHPDFEVQTLTFLLWKTLRLAVTHLIAQHNIPQLCGSSPHWKNERRPAKQCNHPEVDTINIWLVVQ